MRRWSLRVVAAVLLAGSAVAGCSTTARRSAPGGVPAGTPEAASPSGATADSARARYSEADVRFMQRMIGHHAQALEMTSLVPARSSREDMQLLAKRIEASQQHEIGLMRRWLEHRGEEAPSVSTHHEQQHEQHHEGAGHEGMMPGMMPGMLTPEELARLSKATGAEFDRLFLQFMIRHHEGALTMVSEFFATPGAGQEPEIFSLASEIDGDQRAEIKRMRALQDAASPGANHR